MKRNLHASRDRITADLTALAAITEPERPWTRRAFSPLFDEGRRFLSERFRAAGLDISLDAGANLVGLRQGREPHSGTIMLGSHSDTVPDGGRFDGVAGVVVALEVARVLADRGVMLRHNLAITDFLAEEVSIFGVSCIGSRAMAGVLPPAWLERQSAGRDLRRAIGDVGGNAEALTVPLRHDLRAFLEMHIEQGPILEREGLSLGMVTTIVGITRVEVSITGRPDHAGTTPMDGRADALAAASELVLAIRAKAVEMTAAGRHFTATVGEFEMKPNAANVVPGHVRMLIDIRAETEADMEAFLRWVNDRERDEHENGIVVETRKISENDPVRLDDALVDALSDAASALDIGHRRMVSGAGHDAAFMARLCPAAMVFVPCAGGRSHCPEEWADAADLSLAAEVLADTVISIDANKEG
ncbi:Zn-dependent hydrolase [Martelella sp. FLE1502]